MPQLHRNLSRPDHRGLRIAVVVMAIFVMALLYVLQRESLFLRISNLFGLSASVFHPYTVFIFNKTTRLILNDLACMAIIWAVFQKRSYLRLSWYLFLFELLVVLPVYFVIKLNLEGDSEISSPLLSQIHRMIVNPTLMILLIFGFVYQKMRRQ